MKTEVIYYICLQQYKIMEVQIINRSKHELPSYETLLSAGMDIKANISEAVTLKPLERVIIKTGLFISLPKGLEAQVRPRSGLAAKKGVTVLNSPGTIDADYRGELKVILINLSNETQVIEFGDKIAQAVICPVIQGRDVKLNRVKEIKEKDRNSNGFGSTGN